MILFKVIYDLIILIGVIYILFGVPSTITAAIIGFFAGVLVALKHWDK